MNEKQTKLRAVIFDSDGTLIDSRKGMKALYDELKARLGLPPLTAEEESLAFVSSRRQTIGRIFPPELQAQALDLIGRLKPDYFLPLVRLQPGVIPFLDRLVDRGVRLAVNTNAAGDVDQTYRRLEIDHYFEMVVSCDDVINPKPDKEGVELILSRLNLTAGEVIYVGDSMVDQQTAANAGVRFWAYANPDLAAEVHLKDFSSPPPAELTI